MFYVCDTGKALAPNKQNYNMTRVAIPIANVQRDSLWCLCKRTSVEAELERNWVRKLTQAPFLYKITIVFY